MNIVPKYVFYLTDNEFPKTASGKIQKFALRERAVKMLREEKEPGSNNSTN